MNDDVSKVLRERLDGVDGWLHLDEAAALYESVGELDEHREPLTIVEIGSWKGRSTITLASALLDAGREGTVVAIDPHVGSVEHQRRWGAVDTFDAFMDNLDAAGVRDVVTPMRMTSHEAAGSFEPASVDLLFVDGSHEYVDVRQDIDDWLPLLRAPAMVGFNDTSWPGVYRAMRERVIRSDAPFGHPRLVRSTLFVRYDPTTRWADDPAARPVARNMRLRRAGDPLKKVLPSSIKSVANRLTSSSSTPSD